MITPADTNLITNTDKTYKVTLNLHSTNLETYNGTVNTTATIRPLKFDCYGVITSAATVIFSNQLTFSKSDGSDLPSWMTFNPSTGSVSTSVPSDTHNN